MEHITKGDWEAYLVEMPDTWIVCSGENGEDGVAKMIDENQEANAHLVAAAPDMLEALKQARALLREAGYHTDLIDQALAKAEER